MSEQFPLHEKAFAALRILVPVILIGWLLSQLELSKILPLLWQISPSVMLASLGLFVVSQIVIAVRWYLLLRFQKISVPFARLLGLVFVGAFVSNFLPTTVGGDVVKMIGLSQGQPKRAILLASVVTDRLYNLLGIVFLLPLALTLRGLPISNQLLWLPVIGMASFPLFAHLNKWLGQIQSKASRLWDDVKSWFTSPACIFVALLLSWLSTLLSFGSFWIITRGLGIPITYWQASGVATLSYFVALIPVAINGLGLQEGSLTYLLTLQGASIEQGLTSALLIRLVTVTSSLIGGIRLFFGWRGLLMLAVNSEVSSDPKTPLT